MCKFEGCEKKAQARGLCHGHYWQDRQGHPLTPLRKKQASDIGIPGYRRCNNCEEIKKVEHFYQRSGKSSYYSRCKLCHNIRQEATDAH